jgi:hypothetical protein
MPEISEILESPGFQWDYATFENDMPAYKCHNMTEYRIQEDTIVQCCNQPLVNLEDSLQNHHANIVCSNTTRYRGVEV